MNALRPVCVGIVLLCVPVLRADELRTLKNDVIKGDLSAIGPKEIVLDVGGGKKSTTPIDQVLSLVFNNQPVALGPNDKFAQIELTDGTQLKCATYAIKGKDAKLTLLGGQVVDLPLAKITWILNEAHVAAHVNDFKDKVLSKKKIRDMLAFKSEKGDVVNAVEGTIGDADEKGEKFEFIQKDGKKREVAMSRPLAMFFLRQADAGNKPTVCRFTDINRNLVFVADIANGADGLTLTASCGATMKFGKDQAVRLDYSAGKLAYLSQLAPSAVVETSTENSVQHYTRDSNLEGKDIKLGGVEYKRGICLHSHTELTYDLDGEFRELKAIVGIDETVGGIEDEATVLKIYGDGVELLQWSFKRTDKEKSKPLNLNVKDVKKLMIVVTTGDVLDIGKHLALAEARVSK